MKDAFESNLIIVQMFKKFVHNNQEMHEDPYVSNLADDALNALGQLNQALLRESKESMDA